MLKPHFLPLPTEVQISCWKSTVLWPFWSSGFLVWMCRHWSVFTNLLLLVTALFITMGHSFNPCLMISSAVLCVYISIHTSFTAFHLWIFVWKTAHSYLEAAAYLYCFSALLPPFPLSWHANVNAQLFYLCVLMERFVKRSSLGGEKGEFPQCTRCRS